MTVLSETVDIVIGVDTRKHTHTAAAVAARTGAVLEERTVSAEGAGYETLLRWADSHGPRRAWAVEGSGSYGAGLTRFLQDRGEEVIEVDGPWRARRRNGAKSDSIDAVRAARESLGRTVPAQPRIGGQRAAPSAIPATRRSAVKAAADAWDQLDALVITAPEPLRKRFRGRSSSEVPARARRLRVDPRWDVETRTTAEVLRCPARRVEELRAEADRHKRAIADVVRAERPDLLDVFGVGPVVAAVVLCAWSHPGRFRSDAAFANLAGVAPIPASSGMTTRHRLNRSGDRQLNRALHTVAVTRLRCHDTTRAYAERRRSEGKTDRDIKRCLKRYIARELFRLLETAGASAS